MAALICTTVVRPPLSMPRSPLIVATLLIAITLSGCIEAWTSEGRIKSSYSAEDGRRLFELLLTDPTFKDLADRVEPVTVHVVITAPQYKFVWPETDHGGLSFAAPKLKRVEDKHDRFTYLYADGTVSTISGGDPDFTLQTTSSVALGVLNADDGFRVFACAVKDNAATFDASNALYAASFNAAKGRLLESTTDCRSKVGDAATWKGKSGVLFVAPWTKDKPNPLLIARMGGEDGDYVGFDKYRAPVSWYNASKNYCDGIDCSGAGRSQGSGAMKACAKAVEDGYAKLPEESEWQTGVKVSKSVQRSAELTACKLVTGGK